MKILATIGGTGEMEEAGLPNITGSQTSVTAYHTNGEGSSGALRVGTSVGNGYAGGDYGTYDLNFNASLSNPIYGNSDTVTPQNFGVIVGVYAVGAVSAPIGETDAANLLNGISVLETGKASVDLSNLSTAGRSLAAGLGMPSGRYVDLTLGASGTVYTAPADGYVSSVMSGTISGNMGFFTQIYDTSGKEVRRIGTQSGSTGYKVITQNFEIKKGYTFTLATYGTTPNFFRFIYAEGAE